MSGCGADTTANELIDSLTEGVDFSVPTADLTGELYKVPIPSTTGPFAPVQRLTNEDLTEGKVGGKGTFDALMRAMLAHIRAEFDAGRITGAEYTKAYIAMIESAMANATQYLLGRDQAYWNAVAAQVQAKTADVQLVRARVELETSKVQLQTLKFEALNTQANYALTKMRLSNESVQYCISQYNLTNTLPKQLEMLTAQVKQAGYETDTTKYNLDFMLPKQLEMVVEQVRSQKLQADTAMYNLNSLMPKQLAQLTEQIAGAVTQRQIGEYNLSTLLPSQNKMVTEQMEAQRAQTSDTRTDGTTVFGILGRQKDLYAQQIVSYKRDSEMKAGKLWVDAWITMKTIDEGLAPPNSFTNANLDVILGTLKANNGL